MHSVLHSSIISTFPLNNLRVKGTTVAIEIWTHNLWPTSMPTRLLNHDAYTSLIDIFPDIVNIKKNINLGLTQNSLTEIDCLFLGIVTCVTYLQWAALWCTYLSQKKTETPHQYVPASSRVRWWMVTVKLPLSLSCRVTLPLCVHSVRPLDRMSSALGFSSPFSRNFEKDSKSFL